MVNPGCPWLTIVNHDWPCSIMCNHGWPCSVDHVWWTMITMIDHEPTLQSGAGNNTRLKWAQLNNGRIRREHVFGHFLGRNSKYSQDHSIPKILSFEETKVADSISKCSSESFAQRQTPYDATHFTTPISSDELLSSPTKHFSKDNMKGIESSSGCMETKTLHYIVDI